jgi:four helix bundle protein
MRNFKELVVWQNAHRLAIDVYKATRGFPDEERFGLTSQLRRSAASISANIAEGCGKYGDRELTRFLNIAAGSASETECHLILAHDLGFLTKDAYVELDQKVNDIKRMLYRFIQKLKAANT